jgi:hypothetical protein
MPPLTQRSRYYTVPVEKVPNLGMLFRNMVEAMIVLICKQTQQKPSEPRIIR